MRPPCRLRSQPPRDHFRHTLPTGCGILQPSSSGCESWLATCPTLRLHRRLCVSRRRVLPDIAWCDPARESFPTAVRETWWHKMPYLRNGENLAITNPNGAVLHGETGWGRRTVQWRSRYHQRLREAHKPQHLGGSDQRDGELIRRLSYDLGSRQQGQPSPSVTSYTAPPVSWWRPSSSSPPGMQRGGDCAIALVSEGLDCRGYRLAVPFLSLLSVIIKRFSVAEMVLCGGGGEEAAPSCLTRRSEGQLLERRQKLTLPATSFGRGARSQQPGAVFHGFQTRQ